ncbi:lipid particle protein [Pholiota molesta]|nr:lipid particle protein [Pholiota molesta]
MAPVHLLVLIHGMWGNSSNLAELARIARETHSSPSSDGTRLHLLVARRIQKELTYDGVDWCGEQVVKEVVETVKELASEGDQVIRFSVTGYSLGGLIARYCLGVLDQRGFFENVERINFNTIATPHCGLPRCKSLLSWITSSLGPKLLSRTGEQFFAVDKWSPTGRPLLVVMADPDLIFYKALAKFKHIRIYANAINDSTVPYVTAAIETSDPFIDYETNGLEVDFQKEYAHMISQYSLPTVPQARPPPPTVLSPDWFKGVVPTRPLINPFLQFRFPINILLYTLLPVLVPAALSLLVVHCSLATRSSRARIEALEAEDQGGGRRALLDLVEQLELEMEEAVVDNIDDPNRSPMYPPSSVSKGHPIISPTHKIIASWLNKLPIDKELVFFPAVRNAHGMIISRDVKHFPTHRQGESVIRHWATSFIL